MCRRSSKKALVADVGCGRGRGLIKMGQAFPNSRYVGYDVFEPSVARTTTNAKAAGVADRVRFQQLDASTRLPEQYDVITTFDVIHDAVDPRAMLRSIRQALRPDGVYVCLDINCSERLEENAGPLGAMFHGFSVFYCMTTSLANGGVGLGTVGLHEPKVRELCAEAGFSSVRLCRWKSFQQPVRSATVNGRQFLTWRSRRRGRRRAAADADVSVVLAVMNLVARVNPADAGARGAGQGRVAAK